MIINLIMKKETAQNCVDIDITYNADVFYTSKKKYSFAANRGQMVKNFSLYLLSLFSMVLLAKMKAI